MENNLLPQMTINNSNKFLKLFDLGLEGMGAYFLIIELQKNQSIENKFKLYARDVMSWFKEFGFDFALALKIMNTPELFTREDGFVYCPETQSMLLKQHNKSIFNSHAGKLSAAKRKEKQLQ